MYLSSMEIRKSFKITMYRLKAQAQLLILTPFHIKSIKINLIEAIKELMFKRLRLIQTLQMMRQKR